MTETTKTLSVYELLVKSQELIAKSQTRELLNVTNNR